MARRKALPGKGAMRSTKQKLASVEALALVGSSIWTRSERQSG